MHTCQLFSITIPTTIISHHSNSPRAFIFKKKKNHPIRICTHIHTDYPSHIYSSAVVVVANRTKQNMTDYPQSGSACTCHRQKLTNSHPSHKNENFIRLSPRRVVNNVGVYVRRWWWWCWWRWRRLITSPSFGDRQKLFAVPVNNT